MCKWRSIYAQSALVRHGMRSVCMHKKTHSVTRAQENCIVRFSSARAACNDALVRSERVHGIIMLRHLHMQRRFCRFF